MDPQMIDRLKSEVKELDTKLSALQRFIGSYEYSKIEITQRGLLLMQEKTMQDYLEIVSVRLQLMTKPTARSL